MSKKFEILRVEKIRGGGSLAAAFAHCTRERTTDNADANLLGENRYSDFVPLMDGKDTGRLMAKHREMLQGCRVQDKANTCLEYVITASPDIMGPTPKETQDEYFRAVREWVAKKHEEKNIVAVFLHRDEQNPHLHIFVVPKMQHRDRWGNEYVEVGAGPYTDGSKKLSQMQTDFHNQVGVRFGLDRGIEGSAARHDRVKKMYGKINQTAEMVNELAAKRTEALEKSRDKWKGMAMELKNVICNGTEEDLKNTRKRLMEADRKREQGQGY